MQAAYAAIELNVSCPNTEEGGIDLRQRSAGPGPRSRVSAGAGDPSLPLIVKLSPNVGRHHGRRLAPPKSEGADILSLVNTFVGMADRRGAAAAGAGTKISGGLSGPAIRPAGRLADVAGLRGR